MNIVILAVGKLKEKYLQDGIKEYKKRLKPFCHLDIIEVAEEKVPETLSDAEKQRVLKKEGERILEKLTPSSFVIPLCVEGERYSSKQMAQKMSDLMVSGISHITFVIGGTLGLSDEVKARGHLKLSFSTFTFPHQLMRLIFVEQLYRWFKIIRGEPYHR
ncbi:MAG TPA: 23S rRNA (pseudouridine(1915)-N(3))-methyltransferase RlmH [Thermoanaerobacterales bacterium]|nr:23S rRNA (pseudouridine(1915)-N(3))-methyltransferase RlmH [Thermoanaerobacterales bacterium]